MSLHPLVVLFDGSSRFPSLIHYQAVTADCQEVVSKTAARAREIFFSAVNSRVKSYWVIVCLVSIKSSTSHRVNKCNPDY